jgi:hypothetical protein
VTKSGLPDISWYVRDIQTGKYEPKENKMGINYPKCQ